MYDITKYLNDHPGGPEIMLDLAGKLCNQYLVLFQATIAGASHIVLFGLLC